MFMIIETYLILILFAFGLLFTGLYFITRTNEGRRKNPVGAVVALFLSSILFFVVAKASFNIEIETCSNNPVGEICSLELINKYELYIYGNNYTDYHWDYDYPGPQTTDTNLFHQNTTYVYDEICYNSTVNNLCTKSVIIQEAEGTIFNIFGVIDIVFIVLFALWMFTSIGK